MNFTVNALKGLVIDGVHYAKSGHPGGAMSSMDFAYILFTEYLRFDPSDPNWLGRDRFVLSAGHESMLQYALLFAIGWLEKEDLENFRQLNSRTPGHPENTHTPGVECTTGPLGQGVAMSVGFAIAAKHFGATLGKDLFSQRVYSLMGDGCVQEGVTLGAASLAGHLGLDNLVWFYDRNRKQISGDINRVTSEDHQTVFKGFGWQVMTIDGHDHRAIREALDQATTQKGQPTLIIGDTVMAKGAANVEGDHGTHGAPLQPDERLATKIKLGMEGEDFHWPQEAKDDFERHFSKRQQETQSWKETLAKKKTNDAEFSKLFQRCFEEKDFSDLRKLSWAAEKPLATRNVFGEILASWADQIPGLIGGSADLEPSNMTGAFAKKVGDFQRDNPQGRNLAFGVREFPMSAISNGLALFGGLVPFDATFLSFADYSRPALRLGAIQKVRVIHEFTHDSIYLGEDGPTHQPIEHLMSLRSMPDFLLMRPADARETQELMLAALRDGRPSAICLSRQKLPVLTVAEDVLEKARFGAYVVRDAEDYNLILMATGSEVSLALEVAEQLRDRRVRVVSMPCWELFEEQPTSYRDSVLPPHMSQRVSIELGTTLGWQKYTGLKGLNLGIDSYGASAPMGALAEAFGFTVGAICEKIQSHNFA